MRKTTKDPHCNREIWSENRIEQRKASSSESTEIAIFLNERNPQKNHWVFSFYLQQWVGSPHYFALSSAIVLANSSHQISPHHHWNTHTTTKVHTHSQGKQKKCLYKTHSIFSQLPLFHRFNGSFHCLFGLSDLSLLDLLFHNTSVKGWVACIQREWKKYVPQGTADRLE